MNLKQYKQVLESELFKIGPIVGFIWENREKWPVLSVSENIKTIYGYRADEFLSSSLHYIDIIYSEDIEQISRELSQAIEANSLSLEHSPYRIKCKNGQERWVQDTTVIVRDGEKITHFIGYLTDITQLQNLQIESQTQKEKLLNHQALFQSYQIAMDESSIVSKSDLHGRITYANDAFCEISGYTREEVLGKPHSILKSSFTAKENFKELWQTITAKKVWKGILCNRGKNGYYWINTSILPILDANDNIVEYIAVRHDITKMVLQQQKLDNIANTDTLTGYGNRYKLNNDIKHSIKPALAILNIDNFSEVNDFYGHVQGDMVIQKLGELLDTMVKEGDCELYHLQGDEYVLFNPDTKAKHFIEKIHSIAQKVRRSAITIAEEDFHLNLSTGISFESIENLLESADMALKIAKKSNSDLIVYKEEISLNKEYEENLKWARKIKEAIKNNSIVPVFQPIVNNTTSIWEKYESLVRLQESDGTLISPYFFLEISKKTKLYNTITKIMIEKSFEVFKDKEAEFSINLTIEDILNRELNIYLLEMLERYKIGSRVVFEIVESESIENFEEITEFVQNIKAHGAKIAIDDFGTGYSNFEYLMKIKADYIKIDGSMIKDIDTNKEAQLVVSTIVEFAKKLNIKTIAEFVENESVFNSVKALGIDYTQGYYFSKPLLKI